MNVGIVGPIARADRAPAADTAFEVLTHFLRARLFQLIGATTDKQRTGRGDGEERPCHARKLEERLPLGKKMSAPFGGCVVGLAVKRLAASMIEPELLLEGYRLGVFPMAMDDGAIEWFSPDPRGILPLPDFHVPHGLQRALRAERFEIRINTCFAAVMRACAEREDTWINREIIASYTRLHELGHAHSVEAWADNKLAGGLYGVSLGAAFFGESMFHHVTDASKIALCALIERLRARKFQLLDTQWLTPHLKRFGGIEISRADYLHRLDRAAGLKREFDDESKR